MKTNDFVEAFCGADRTPLETYREMGYHSQHDIHREMTECRVSRHITEPDGEIADVNIRDCVYLFTDILLDELTQ